MKQYTVRMEIRPTDIKYTGFYQYTNCYSTTLKTKGFEASSWKEAATILKEIFGDEIISLTLTYERTDEERKVLRKKAPTYTIV